MAVLPFENMSADPEQEFFSDGISDEIINHLAKIEPLKVIARHSSFAFKGKDDSIASIAEQLNVRHVLEGSVRRSGNRVRITAQLVDAKDSSPLWSQTFDSDFNAEDFFRLQTDIAAAIVNVLVGKLAPQHELVNKEAPTTNSEAYRLYLLAQHRLGRGTSEAAAEAVEYLQQATSIDPKFAAAYVALARSYWTLRDMTGNWPEDVSKEGVKALVQRALELDDTYGEAHAMLGLLVWKEDPQRAQAEFDRAVLGSPGSAFIYEAQGYFLGQIRDFRGALRVYEKGIRLNPLSAGLLANAGSVAHPYDTEAALAYYRQAIEVEPTYVRAYNRLGTAYWTVLGQLDEAMLWLRRGYAIDPEYVNTIAMIGWVYLDLNADDDAERWFRHGMSKGPEYALPRLGLADVFHARDQHDEEFRLLDTPVDEFTSEGTARERICLHMLNDGRYEEFLAECATLTDHGLLADKPDNMLSYWDDLGRARALWHLGRVGEAEAIWIELEERFASSAPRDAGVWPIFLVELHADQGQIERAVDELQEAADSGWRFFWQGFFRQIFDDGNDPQAKFWSDPRVVAMGEEIARDVARQLENVRKMEQAAEIAPLSL